MVDSSSGAATKRASIYQGGRLCGCGYIANTKQQWNSHTSRCGNAQEEVLAAKLGTPVDADELLAGTTSTKDLVNHIRFLISEVTRQNKEIEQLHTNQHNMMAVLATLQVSKPPTTSTVHVQVTEAPNSNEVSTPPLEQFGNEDCNLSHEFSIDCLKARDAGITKVIRDIYFNPKRPANQTIRINCKSNLTHSPHAVYILTREGWTPCAPNRAFLHMWKTALECLQRVYDDLEWDQTFDDTFKTLAAPVQKWVEGFDTCIEKHKDAPPIRIVEEIRIELLKALQARNKPRMGQNTPKAATKHGH